MSTQALICVFAKPPDSGVAKTRLAASVGADRAAALARAFLQDTWAMATGVEWARTALATTTDARGAFGLPGHPEIWLQGEGDLGTRIERIARRALAGAELVIAIGADSPDLPVRLIEQARRTLSQVDAVLGPAEDGGFYLIGLRRCPEGLLDDLPWSAPTTFAATRAQLEARGLTGQTLERWFDVDRSEDLERLRTSLEHGVTHAPATANLLLR